MAQIHARKLHHETYYLEPSTWERGRNIIAFIGLVALAASGVGAFADPARFRQSWLVGFASAVTIVLGGMFFVMIQYLTGSAWSVTLRRIMENLMVTIPVGALAFVPISFGLHDLYEWTNASVMAHDKILQGKAVYLN